MLPTTTTRMRKKFCKYCWDRGLPATDCFSHFVKDRKGPGGVIICPTLLSDDCMRCGLRGHTPRYCTSTTPLLTIDCPDPSNIDLMRLGLFRLISYETWIEPIPPHLRAQHTRWKTSHALQRRRREMVESRYKLRIECDMDTNEEALALYRWFGDDGDDTRVHDSYNDFELEILAKFDVHIELIKQHFPNGCENLTEVERLTLRDIIAASCAVIYSWTDEMGTKTFHVYSDSDSDSDSDTTATAIESKFSASDYQSRVLAMLNDSQHPRRR